jgi:tripartite-type tricarboxylate transporter receptor subunit TctC
MKLPRRNFLHLAAGAAALPAVSRVARAQAYPSRPVHLMVGFAAGGGYDIVARLIGQWLSERLGQPFVIENRPGAGTNIATEAVVRAPPDGYTLLLIGSTNAINTTFYQKLNFNFLGDITPVSSITQQPQAMLTNPSFPAKTIPELIAYAKANPGKVTMSSPGVGSISHLAGELFKMMAGVNLVHVPFGGNSPALTALLGGQVDVSSVVDRAYENRQATWARGHHRNARGGATGRSKHRRVCHRLRCDRMVWCRRAKGYTCRYHQ